MKLTEGQVSDYKGAALLMDAIDALPEARELLADRGYDADWFRDPVRQRHYALHPSRKEPKETRLLR